MEAANIARLQEEQQKAFSETEDQIKQFDKFRKDYQALTTRLKTLPDKLTHDVMVPFGKLAFMPGKIVHTNEIMVLLGDNWFVERSAKQAREIAGRRISELDERINGLKEQQSLLGSRLGFTSELQAGAEDQADYREIMEEYDEEKERQWDEQHRINVSKYHQQMKREKSSSTKKADDDSARTKKSEDKVNLTTAEKDGDVWSRLAALEQQEEERGEMNSSFEESDHEEVGEDRLKGDPLHKEDSRRNSSQSQTKKVVWEDEERSVANKRNSSPEDSDDDSGDNYIDEDQVEEEEEESGCGRSRPVVKTITFSHSKAPSAASVDGPPSCNTDKASITSPGEIYKLFSPRPILRKTPEELMTSSTSRVVTLPDPSGDHGSQHVKDKLANVECGEDIGNGSITSSRDKAFTGIVMENPSQEVPPQQPSSSSNTGATNSKRVSKFRAQRMGQNDS